MKKLVSAMVSVCLIGMLFVLQSCSNPSTSSVGGTGNNNGSTLNLPAGVEDDEIYFDDFVIETYNPNTSEYNYEVLIYLKNVYPDELEYVIVENPDNLVFSNSSTFKLYEGNITASHAKAQYSLWLKIPASSVTSNHRIVIAVKNTTRNFTYGQQWSDPIIRSIYQKELIIHPITHN